MSVEVSVQSVSFDVVIGNWNLITVEFEVETNIIRITEETGYDAIGGSESDFLCGLALFDWYWGLWVAFDDDYAATTVGIATGCGAVCYGVHGSGGVAVSTGGIVLAWGVAASEGSAYEVAAAAVDGKCGSVIRGLGCGGVIGGWVDDLGAVS